MRRPTLWFELVALVWLALLAHVKADFNETIDDSNAQIAFDGPAGHWHHNTSTGSCCLSNTLSASSSEGLSFEFQGKTIYLLSKVFTAGANISISLDGQQDIISTSGPVDSDTTQVVWHSGPLDESAAHKIILKHQPKDTGFQTTDPQGSVWLTIDAFLITHSSNDNTQTPINNPTPSTTPQTPESISSSHSDQPASSNSIASKTSSTPGSTSTSDSFQPIFPNGTVVTASLTSESTSTSTSTPLNAAQSSPIKSHRNVIIGSVIGGVLALIIALICGFIFYRRRRSRQSDRDKVASPLHTPSSNFGLVRDDAGNIYLRLPRRSNLFRTPLDETMSPSTPEEYPPPPMYSKSR